MPEPQHTADLDEIMSQWDASTGDADLDAVLSGRAPDPNREAEPEGYTPTPTADRKPKPDPANPGDSRQDADPLRDALRFDESDEQRLQRVSTENETLRSQHQELQSRVDAVNAWLESQGIELTSDDQGSFVPVLRDGVKNPKAPDVKVRYDDLPADVQDAFADDYQRGIDAVVEIVRKRMEASIQPVADRPPQPPSETVLNGIVEAMASAVRIGGGEAHPRLRENLPYIQDMVKDPSFPGLSRLYATSPRQTVQLLNAFVEQQRHLVEQAGRSSKERDQQRRQDVSAEPAFGPSTGTRAGRGSGGSGSAASWADEQARRIAEA